MLSNEQILILRKDPFYKKTRGIRYNWKYSKAIVSAPYFSLKVDISKNGIPWEQWGLFWKIIIFLFNRFIISKEIGIFRSEAIERILDNSIGDDFDICTLITPNLKWVSQKSEKMIHIKNFTIKFITDSEVQLSIYNSSRINENDRIEFLKNLQHKIDCIFDYTIALLMKDDSVASQKDLERFMEMHRDTLTSFFRKQSHTGNLFIVPDNVEEESDNG